MLLSNYGREARHKRHFLLGKNADSFTLGTATAGHAMLSG